MSLAFLQLFSRLFPLPPILAVYLFICLSLSHSKAGVRLLPWALQATRLERETKQLLCLHALALHSFLLFSCMLSFVSKTKMKKVPVDEPIEEPSGRLFLHHTEGLRGSSFFFFFFSSSASVLPSRGESSSLKSESICAHLDNRRISRPVCMCVGIEHPMLRVSRES